MCINRGILFSIHRFSAFRISPASGRTKWGLSGLSARISGVVSPDSTKMPVMPASEDYYGREFAQSILRRKQYSFTWEGIYADVLVEFDEKPEIQPGQTLTGVITLINHTMPEQKHYRLRLIAPDGWQTEYKKNLFTPALISHHRPYVSTAFSVQAGDTVEAVNRLILEVVSPGRPTPILVPIQIMG